MNRKRFWKIVTLAVVFLLMISVSYEIRLLGIFIETIGLDMFILLFEVQILAIFISFYNQLVRPVLVRVNWALNRIDPYYFVPSIDTIKKCPAILVHSVPLLVPCYLILFLGLTVYS